MTFGETWSEWRFLMIESEYIKALLVGYLPHEIDSSKEVPGSLRFCRRGLVAERALTLMNLELETGKVVSIVWREEYFDSLTVNLTESGSDIWDLNIALPLSADLHKLGLESLDREQVIGSFFASPEVFNEMSPNRELDMDLAPLRQGSRVTTIGVAH